MQKKVSALLHCHLYGQAGARALINTLIGKNNPFGHLAETFLLKYEDTPSYSYFHKLRKVNNQIANTLIMGVYHQPMRGLSKMTGGAVRWEELKGLLIMFNGKFFKGLGTYFKALKLRKQDRKEK